MKREFLKAHNKCLNALGQWTHIMIFNRRTGDCLGDKWMFEFKKEILN